MKQIIRQCLSLLVVALFLFSQAAVGVIITQNPHLGTDVGSIDIFISEANMQGNPAAETAWVNSVLATSGIAYSVQTETVDYFLTDTADVYAFELQSATTGYFVIKNAQRVALFQNIGALDWGVFDANSLTSAINLPGEEFQISHVTELNGRNVNVPEPSTVVLLGLGLVGISLAGRKRIINQANGE
ncbi:MAG: PEP-CTERM sorting domain-containing protein [Candidatus Thiodiazotropha endolucinida]